MPGIDTLLSSLIYQAIGEPENWQQSSIEPLIRLLTDKYDLDDPRNMDQIRMGKELVGRLSEKESIVSAVMNIFDGARYGWLIVDQNYKVVYHSEKINEHLGLLLDGASQTVLDESLCEAIKQKIDSFDALQNGEAIRLDYQKLKNANLYLRKIEQANSHSSSPDYLHHIMVADGNDSNNQVFQEVSKTYGLSAREIGIVQSAVKALAAGGSTKDIADDLFISMNTVKTHLKSIYAKSGVNSLASLVSLYLQHEVQQLVAYFGGSSQQESTIEHKSDRTLVLNDGQLICYREYGEPEGRPLIVLHNSYSSRLNIPPEGSLMASRQGRRIIIPDRPGFGKSPANEKYPSIWSSQLAEISEILNLGEFDILGNALSVRYALEFAQAYPEKLSKMILVAPLLHTGDEDRNNFSDWLCVATQLYERNPEVATEIYKLWHSSASLRLHDHVEKNLAASISSAEKNIMNDSRYVRVVKDNFKEAAAQQGQGSSSDFKYCFNKMTLDLSQILTQTEVWVGSEDSLNSPLGVKKSLHELPHKTVFEKDGYGEHIYYSLFEKIIA